MRKRTFEPGELAVIWNPYSAALLVVTEEDARKAAPSAKRIKNGTICLVVKDRGPYGNFASFARRVILVKDKLYVVDTLNLKPVEQHEQSNV